MKTKVAVILYWRENPEQKNVKVQCLFIVQNNPKETAENRQTQMPYKANEFVNYWQISV